MTLQKAIDNIHAPKGLTSILSGLMTGDYSVLPHENGIGADHEKAKQEVAKWKQALNECKSDWAYWSILGDLAYWEAIESIYQAAAIVGPDNLPDVPKPNLDGLVVMDCIGKVQQYGNEILNEAKKQVTQ